MNITSLIKRAKTAIDIPMPKSFGKFKIKLQKHQPDIMLVGGALILVGSAVYACKKTLDARDILEDANTKLKNIDYGQDIADGNESFDDKVARKERVKVYRKLTFDLGKCYGPAIIGGVTGFALIFGANKIQKDRNAALGVAYANLLASYKNYRDRVKNELGEDKEFELNSGAKREDIEYVDEEGNTQTQKDALVVYDDGSVHSPYARIFDESCPAWSKSPSSNLIFLKKQQAFANDKLRAEGFLFLNDVYEMLGFPRTSEGQIVGWLWDPNNEIIREERGDNHVDFGIYSSAFKSSEVRDFINGVEPCIWLDFNVDGRMYDLI